MISLPQKPKIIEKKDNFAVFEVEALYPGYGVTIGNTLRRVLLSSLPGAAVTQVKIKGVQHEFSTITGITEDVITILLNLKQLRFKIHADDPQKATLSVKGEKNVKGSDFKLPAQLELMNKDSHVATLTEKKAELEMEIIVEKGLGYEPVETRKKGKSEIGTIAMDAIFTPVRKVSYRVENMRVGDKIDYDRLFLELETDGTISPEEAFSMASDVLIKHFSLFEETLKPEKEVGKKENEKEELEEDVNKIKVEDMKFSARTLNALLKNNIKSLGGLARKGEESLLELEGMGDKGIKEVKRKLKKFNLELK
ncbi:MAG: DNA-directed RNA polymerase subunit alpha [Candidatus Nealsonbacteria bacterium]